METFSFFGFCQFWKCFPTIANVSAVHHLYGYANSFHSSFFSFFCSNIFLRWLSKRNQNGWVLLLLRRLMWKCSPRWCLCLCLCGWAIEPLCVRLKQYINSNARRIIQYYLHGVSWAYITIKLISVLKFAYITKRWQGFFRDHRSTYAAVAALGMFSMRMWTCSVPELEALEFEMGNMAHNTNTHLHIIKAEGTKCVFMWTMKISQHKSSVSRFWYTIFLHYALPSIAYVDYCGNKKHFHVELSVVYLYDYGFWNIWSKFNILY